MSHEYRRLRLSAETHRPAKVFPSRAGGRAKKSGEWLPARDDTPRECRPATTPNSRRGLHPQQHKHTHWPGAKQAARGLRAALFGYFRAFITDMMKAAVVPPASGPRPGGEHVRPRS